MLYIYYTQQHMVEEYASDISALQNLQITKNQILDNAIAKHQQRMKQDTNQLSDQDSKKIEDLLYGDGWVNNLNQRKLNSGATRAGDYGYSDIITQIASLKSSIKSKSSSVSNFTKQLSAFITTVEKEYNPIRNEYAKAVVDKFVKNNRVGSKTANKIAAGNVAGRILETLRGSYRGQAFRVMDTVEDGTSQTKLSASLGKLAVLSRVLNSSGGKSYIASIEDQHAFWNDIYSSVLKWLDDFDALVEEMGLLNVATKAGEQIAQELGQAQSKIKIEVESTHRKSGARGGLSVQGRLLEDKNLQRDLEMLKKQRKDAANLFSMFANTNQPKADTVINWTDGSVSGQTGISVKKAEDLTVNRLINNVNIKIQSNTPLLTLMLREAEMSYNEVLVAVNIAAALPTHPSLLNVRKDASNYEDMLETTWQNLIEKIKYQSFYSALAGLGGENERVYFMSLNGTIFSIGDLLTRIQNNAGSVSWSAYAGKKAITSGQGLYRSAYQEINKESFVEGPRSKSYGLVRSDKVRPSALSLLQDTKVNISMNLAQIAALI